MHDLLGLEYINSTMCHYMKTEGGEAEEFPMLHYILFSLSSQEKKHDVSLHQSVLWKEVRAFMCACV